MNKNINATIARADGRNDHALRPIEIVYDALGYASASVLFSQGKTKVLASVSLQQGLPHFLKGQPVGWLSAEYAMLPCATHQRTTRESSSQHKNARSVEISRLLGRCLRPTIDLNALRDKTIIIDCDILQADGGTRVASVTAASIALEIACYRWYTEKITDKNIFKERIAAVSLGIVNGKVLTDLTFQEDSNASADFNFVLTQEGNILEIQGTAEKSPIAWQVFDTLKERALDAIREIFSHTSASLKDTLANVSLMKVAENIDKKTISKKHPKSSFFSIGNRLPSK